ncbi:beta-propeller domain-containing protein [Myxococcota bacterium]|nr:beta-propeller domain-containing protein [Myxococcota bacterium]
MRGTRFGVLALTVLVLACGGGESGSGSSGSLVDDGASGSAAVAPSLPDDAPLVPSDAEALQSYLKDGLMDVEVPDFSVLGVAPENSSAPSGGAEPRNLGDAPAEVFSTTNLQTLGVDEADTVKFDGEYLYVARPPELNIYWNIPSLPSLELPAIPPEGEVGGVAPTVVLDEEPVSSFFYPETEVITPASVAVYRAQSDPASAEPLASISLERAGPVTIHGMLTLEGSIDEPPLLVVIATEENRSSGRRLAFWDPWFHNDGLLHVLVFDVQDPEAPQPMLNWRFQGRLLAVRRVGEQLILASTFAPVLRALADISDPALRNQQVRDASIEDLLPQSWLGDAQDPEALVLPERCFVPFTESVPPEEDHRSFFRPILTTVATLNLRDLAKRVSLCAAGPVDRIYSSTRSLYLAATRYEYSSAGSESKTVVHKFSYGDDGPRFRGSAVVPGSPAGSQQNFGLGETGDTFGIVTTLAGFDEQGRWEPRHRLTLLEEDPGDALRLVETAHLPNPAQPEPIGKPGEGIYAIRFVGDAVFVVTFQNTDPLYVIDVSNSSAPFVAGELEIPGFSDFLQPLGSDLLLGVGKAAIPSGSGWAWFQGIKVELFDVADPTAPESVDALEIGMRGSASAALRDHQAVNWFDPGSGNLRVTVPVSVHEELLDGDPSSPSAYYGWSRTGLQLLEVDLDQRILLPAGEVVVANPGELHDWDPGTTGDRARLQGDAIHYVHGGQVWSASWSAPEGAVGPQ